jgi:peptide/nickel transport system ATP-binding protein
MRLAAFLLRPDSGTVHVDNLDPWTFPSDARRLLRRKLQVVFQEGADSLDPRQQVAAAVEEPLANFGTPRSERRQRILEALKAVGLPPELIGRYPSEMSGGQRQRVGIARALTLDPELILLDEPVSALDVSSGAQILNLLRDLQSERGLGYTLVSHELPVIRYLSHRVLVMYAGKIVEEGAAVPVLDHPAHPYTVALKAAALTVDSRAGLPEIPAAATFAPSGCAFSSRCPAAMPRCRDAEPPAFRLEDGRAVRCFLYEVPVSAEGEEWKRSSSLKTS